MSNKAPAKAATPAAEEKAPAVEFVSKEKESHQFEVMGIRPSRSNDHRLLFKVPGDLAERFAKHHHVVSGRIIKRPAESE